MLLYDRATSGNSYKIRLFCSLLRLDCETKAVYAEDGRNIVDAAYLALNPRGQIPTLDDDGFVLWGSTAILCYLANRYDDRRCWLPADFQASAEVMQWMELAQNEVTGLFLSRAIQRFGYSGDLAAAQRAGNKALDILEGRLQDRLWLVGDRPTIADISCFPYAAVAWDNGFDLASRPAICRWINGLTALDGFVAMPGMELPIS